MSLHKSRNMIRFCHVVEERFHTVQFKEGTSLEDYTTEIESFIGNSFKFKQMRFVNCHQSIDPNTNLSSLMNKGVLNFKKMFPKESNLLKPCQYEEKEIRYKPLEFVIMKDKQIYDRFEMEEATTATTILGIYKYLCETIKGNWSVLAMHIDRYGTTREMFRNERMNLKSKANRFLLYKIGDFTGNNNIVVTIRDDSYKAVYNSTKSLVTVNVQVYNTAINLPTEGHCFKVRVTDHYNVTFHVTCSPSATVKDILRSICSRAGYDIADVKLTYRGRNLRKDTSLKTFDLHQDADLKIELLLKGGISVATEVIHTVDVTRRLTVTRQWSKKPQPKWRQVSYGLTIRGVCLIKECVAYKETVYCSLGFGRVDLIHEQHNITCPMCKTKFNPEIPGFNNCFYRIFTENINGVECNWKSRADDAYTEFDKEKSGKATFRLFDIKTTRIKPGQENLTVPIAEICQICNKKLSSKDALQIRCSHSFHRDCILHANNGNRLEICPTCNATNTAKN